MSQPNQELQKQFSEIINRLSKEDKQKLYDRLKGMSPEERNKTIVTIVKRYGNNANASSNKSAATSKKEETPAVKKSAAIEDNKKTVENIDRKKQQIADDSEDIPKRPKPKKKLKKSVRVAFTLFIVGLVLVILSVIGFINKDKLATLFGENTGEVVASDVVSGETSEVTDSTEAVPTETSMEETTVSEEPTPIPGPTNVPVVPGSPDLTGLVVVLDPGHQETADDEAEVCAPWLNISKPRCTSGATGSVTGVCEYDLTLQYCLILENYLEQCGATVILTRETNDVNMSNQERAQFALDNNADVFIRIHCDNSNDIDASGVRVYVPDTGDYIETSVDLGNLLGEAVAEAEGLTFDETHATYLYTGLNYANTIPSFQISLGYLSNSENEAILLNPDNELNVAVAFADFCAQFL